MTTLANAVHVLRFFRAGRRSAGVNEIAVALGWPKSSVSRLLKEMASLGLLERVPGSLAYRVGVLPLEIGRWYRSGSALVEATDALLGDITRRTGHGSLIAILDGTEIVVIRSRPGLHPTAIYRPAGNRGSAWTSSTGRVLLARLPDDEILRGFTPFPADPSAAGPKSVEQLLRRLALVRRRGWEETVDEYAPGIAAVSVAVTDPGTSEAVALNLTLPSTETTERERHRLARLLFDVSAQIVAQLGGEIDPRAARTAAR